MTEDSRAVAVDVPTTQTRPVTFDFRNRPDRQLGPRMIRGDVTGNILPDRNELNNDREDSVNLAGQSLLKKLIQRYLVPASPLFSVKTFEQLRLKPELLSGVYSMGFNRPSTIQENTLPAMLAQP